VSRGYSRGEYAEQRFTSAATADGLVVRIGPAVGAYAGKVDRRRYRLTVHDLGLTRAVSVGDVALTRYSSREAYDAAATGWYRDPAGAGVTDVKLPALPSADSATVTLSQAG